MPQGITAIHRLEAEFFQRHCFPDTGVAESLDQWTEALQLPEGWNVIGVTLIPLTDLYIFLLESEQIVTSKSGLVSITPCYIASETTPQVSLRRLTQSSFNDPLVEFDIEEEKDERPENTGHLVG